MSDSARLAERITVDREFSVSNDALHNPEELRRRLAETGYLFLKGIVNKAELLALRREILLLCQEHGWLNPTAALLDGAFRGGAFPDYSGEYMRLYRKLQKIERFNELSRLPEIMQLFEQLLADEVLAQPRTIARISFPQHYANTTQAHQDFFYIRGTPETYTAWIPVGDCPRELGGLALLERSHLLGFLPHEPAIGAGKHGLRTRQFGLPWLSASYELGDMVIFHSYTIHGALDNQTLDQMRLSVD